MSCCVCYEQITLKTTALLVDCYNQLVCECESRMCNECANKLTSKKCPTCRTKFENVMCLGVGCKILPLKPLQDNRDEVLKVILNLLYDNEDFIMEKIIFKLECSRFEDRDYFKNTQNARFAKWLKKCKNEIWTCDNTGRWALFPLDDGRQAKISVLTRKLDEEAFVTHKKTKKNVMFKIMI
jgi:hypothetical protein